MWLFNYSCFNICSATDKKNHIYAYLTSYFYNKKILLLVDSLYLSTLSKPVLLLGTGG